MFRRLSPAEVRPATAPEQFGFTTTAELEPLRDGIGQERAQRAIRFGLAMNARGYNLFVLGAPDTDRRPLVDALAQATAAERPIPPDLCYLHDFAQPVRPRALVLEAGHGRRLRADADRFVEELRSVLPAVFQEDEFRDRISEIAAGFQHEQQAALDQLRTAAEAEGLTLLQTPQGFAFAAAHDGEVLDQESFEALDAATRATLSEANERLTARLVEHMQQMPSRQQDMVRAQREVARELVAAAVTQLVRSLRRHWHELPAVIAWLDAVEADATEHAQTILALEQESEGPAPPGAAAAQDAFYARYRVNLLVDHSASQGGSVVFEGNPTLENLLGRIDQRSEYGSLTTDFTLIRAGALHRANGGVLLLEAERLLAKPFAWDALKRALFDSELRPEQAAEQLGFGHGLSLDAEPMPLDVKVVLIGQRQTYYMLSALEPDFPQLFKVPADLDDRIERNDGNMERQARMLATIVADEHLRHLDAGAVARILDHSVRLAGDASKLSAHARTMADLLREADQLAHDAEAEIITRAHVATAIDNGAERLDRIRSDVHESISQGTVLIDTEGTAIGQLNGLSVLQIGELGFGQPSRITATARVGHGEVIDIEREARLGGRVHAKAVMILNAFLGQRYARTQPLSLNAALVFEQSYGGIEGDSATVAELCALLSAIAELPLRQDIAVTGSMNQHGRVQAIGGANEKVEGFHDVCVARGLTGTQGVLLPEANVRNLMLREDVATAIAQERFHVYAMADVDDALALLSDRAAGACEHGSWTPDSFNAGVAAGLAAFSAAARAAAQAAGAGAETAPIRVVERDPFSSEPRPGPPPGPEDQR